MATSSSDTNYSASSHNSNKNYFLPLIIVSSLFFLWAMGGKMNDILIPHLRKALTLTDFQSSLVQTAFFGAYFFMAVPAGWIMKKVGYKNGIVFALLICTLGAALFYPAAELLRFPIFLLALFVMASGFAMLEVAANPYVSVLGDPATAASRLNLAQGINSLGATITPYIGAQVIFSGVEKSESELSSMSAADLQAYFSFEADRVKLPYLVMAGIFLIIAAIVYMVHLPEIQESDHNNTLKNEPKPSIWSVFKRKQLALGVLGIFVYVGAQEGIAAFVIRFMQYLQIDGINEKMAANYLVFHWGAFMVGRFVGAGLMKRFDPAYMLLIFAGVCTLLVVSAMLTSGMIAVWCVVAVGFFNSIQFPTIFTLALHNLGIQRKDGATFLVMAIVGAALIPPAMGLVSTLQNIQVAFIIPLLCYVYVMFYAWKGCRV